jgi:hypothetical protein
MTKKEQIIKKAFEVLALPEFKSGIRISSLIKKVAAETGENVNTCTGNLWNLPERFPDKVFRPFRGMLILKENERFLKDAEINAKDISWVEDAAEVKMKEADIYEPAMNYLLSEQECTHAIIVGGNAFGRKWGTPDILGIIRASSDATYRPIIELVAVEIKDEGYLPIEALGQAMAYKLFAHRTWLILPDEGNEDISRIQGVAITANIGLVSFTRKEDGFEFITRNRPISGRPDLGEVNDMLEKLKRDKQKYYELIKNEKY